MLEFKTYETAHEYDEKRTSSSQMKSAKKKLNSNISYLELYYNLELNRTIRLYLFHTVVAPNLISQDYLYCREKEAFYSKGITGFNL